MLKEDTTLSAALVQAGVGLPLMWMEPDGVTCDAFTVGQVGIKMYMGSTDCGLDLTNPQTAYGVALKLDAWEHAGAHPPVPGWAEGCGYSHVNPRGIGSDWDADGLTAFLQRLAARVTHIGRDHRIRRNLGRKVEPGTLASVEHDGGALWAIPHLNNSGTSYFTADGVPPGINVPALAGITDPTEAFAIIDEALTEQP